MTSSEIQFVIFPYLVGATVFFIVRAYLISRLLTFAKPLAAEMGKLSGELLESGEVPEKVKEVVRGVCKMPAHPIFMIVGVVFCIPIVIWAAVYDFQTPGSHLKLELKAKYNKVVFYHFLLNAARSPFLFLLFVVETLILLPFKQPLAGIGKGWAYFLRHISSLPGFLVSQDC